MGSSLLRGWLRKGATLENISISDPHPSQWLVALSGDGLRLNPSQIPSPDVVVIATKPQLIKNLGNTLSAFKASETLFLSIAAGTNISTLSEICGLRSAIVRAMPNLPASIGQGVIGFFANKHVTHEKVQLARTLLSAVGDVVELSHEEQLHAVTAVSGSGPAYVFAMAEAMESAGISAGLPRDIAQSLAINTIKGAGALMATSESPPCKLRSNVTSPHGTTQAALAVLTDDANGLKGIIEKTVSAARNRSVALSQTGS